MGWLSKLFTRKQKNRKAIERLENGIRRGNIKVPVFNLYKQRRLKKELENNFPNNAYKNSNSYTSRKRRNNIIKKTMNNARVMPWIKPLNSYPKSNALTKRLKKRAKKNIEEQNLANIINNQRDQPIVVIEENPFNQFSSSIPTNIPVLEPTAENVKIMKRVEELNKLKKDFNVYKNAINYYKDVTPKRVNRTHNPLNNINAFKYYEDTPESYSSAAKKRASMARRARTMLNKPDGLLSESIMKEISDNMKGIKSRVNALIKARLLKNAAMKATRKK